jgi:hypothetical protein
MSIMYLDATLTASRARVSPGIRTILTGLLKEASVVVMDDQYHYRVDFGPNVQPPVHIVDWELACNCSQDEDCPAVTAVKKHLKDGGLAATTPAPGVWPTIPHKCPVCRGMVHYNPLLSSKLRGLGWTCENDKAHYWTHQGQVLVQVCKGKNVATLDDSQTFPFPEGYDPNREYPLPFCRHCGQMV